MKPCEKRDVVMRIVNLRQTSIRRACNIIGLSRSSLSYVKKKSDDSKLISAIETVIANKPSCGFGPRLRCKVVAQGLGHKLFHRLRNQQRITDNHKRVYRIYRLMGLSYRRRYKKRIPERIKEPLMVPARPHICWSMDFMSDSLTSGRRFRTFNVIDDFNREILAIEIDTSLPSSRVVRTLLRLFETYGKPNTIRMDNGPEFTSTVLESFCEAHGVKLGFIQKGKPTQNAFIERFNRSYREEILDAYLFNSLKDVRDLTAEWIEDYNNFRPHESLNNISPKEYARRYLEKDEKYNQVG